MPVGIFGLFAWFLLKLRTFCVLNGTCCCEVSDDLPLELRPRLVESLVFELLWRFNCFVTLVFDLLKACFISLGLPSSPLEVSFEKSSSFFCGFTCAASPLTRAFSFN